VPPAATPRSFREGLRNILVHAYLDIDHGLTWDAIAHELGDLRVFAQVAAGWLVDAEPT